MRKRLIICADGTWNNKGQGFPGNVIKISEIIKPLASDGTQQIVFYEKGLGTNWYDKLPGGAFGWGIDENIQNAYRFLCLNYMAGDEVYLFGFSRGAYTVRSLGGMISVAGLLPTDKTELIASAYDIYRIQNDQERANAAAGFRQAHNSQPIPITVLGCWDTVGALGVPNILPGVPIDGWINQKYRFHNVELSSLIQHALHAMAIDERRRVFDVTPMNVPPGSPTQLHQMWFPGGHGCVGGGTESTQRLSNGTLKWMMDTIQAVGLGLEFNPALIAQLAVDPLTPFNNEGGWAGLVGMIWRKIDRVEAVHENAKQRWCKLPKYRPDNLKPFAAALDQACR